MDSRHGGGGSVKEKVKRLYFGEYLVRGGLTIVKVDMGNYTVKFTLEIDSRRKHYPGSIHVVELVSPKRFCVDHVLDPGETLPHNTLITRSHESLYHAQHERVIQYPLAEFESDRLWKYRPVFH